MTKGAHGISAVLLMAACAGAAPVSFETIRPVLAEYCHACHSLEKGKGDVVLEGITNEAAVLADRVTWEKVLKNLQSRAMPPENKPQPTDEQRKQVMDWLERRLYFVDCDKPDPGRVTIRRLNRAEYNNTIRDLTGVDIQPADDFPADDVGYGFDNIGDVLSMPPLLLEKYLTAAERVMDAATNDVARGRIFICEPTHSNATVCAEQVVARFASRAFRRPAYSNEIQRAVGLYELGRKEGESFEAAVRVALLPLLVSPHFLFRGEITLEPGNPKAVHLVNEYSLAARLSYFLWSSMPDEELFDLAARGQLRKRGVLEKQVKRMLADAKSVALVRNFARQWLQIRNLERVAPDTNAFPTFTEDLRADMDRETELFVEAIIHEDRSIMDLLDGQYTFVNERLAAHYGLAGVTGPEFRRVSLKGTARGGVLTHGSVLTITSNPTRTSPVKRGKWVLDNLLGTPPPPPPPNVPELKEGKELIGTLRERMEQHRADPNCASCHDRMDPIGFGLENFDAIGRWRETDGTDPINTSGKLPGGRTFSGPAELRRILLEQKDLFARCLTEKMLTYALGRGLEYYDRCAVEKITAAMARKDFRFSVLITEIAKSAPFQMRRGEADGAP